MLRIGIDPDIDKSGIAIMQDGKLIKLFNANFLDLFELIKNGFVDYNLRIDYQKYFMTQEAIIYVEDVELIKTVWDRKKKMSNAAKMKLAQNVGMVKAVGRLIGQKLEGLHRPYKLIPPLKGYLKCGKDDTAFFNNLMGWSGRSNADNRDAALLLYPYLKKG